MLEISAVVELAKLTEKLFSASSRLSQKRQADAIEYRKEQLLLLQELTKAGIDPQLFDLMLSTELDRNLKKKFGIAFFVATIAFTSLSYGVIVLNSTLKWGISDFAITGLIIETPLQFMGLLYIIARNLFPQTAPHASASAKASKSQPRPKAGRAQKKD